MTTLIETLELLAAAALRCNSSYTNTFSWSSSKLLLRELLRNEDDYLAFIEQILAIFFMSGVSFN